ncbi:MAG: DNA-directed RNA polymerase subunit omega [Pyrinomonadaceae bacterium]
MVTENEIDEELEEQEVDPVEVDPEEIPEIDSKYRLILLAAQRAKQLQRGALPRVELDKERTKPTTVALKEFKNHRVNFRITKENQEA